jgi:hypothetical protein
MIYHSRLADSAVDYNNFRLAAARGFIDSLNPEQRDAFEALFWNENDTKLAEIALEHCEFKRGRELSVAESDRVAAKTAINYVFGRQTGVVHGVVSYVGKLLEDTTIDPNGEVFAHVRSLLETRESGARIDTRAWMRLAEVDDEAMAHERDVTPNF